MSDPIRSLQAADGQALDVGGLVEALGRRYAVSAGPKRVVQRTHLDTFDRRLHAAGLDLEHDVAAGHETLQLTRSGAPTVTSPAAGLRWPAFAGALPDGPVQAAVAGPAGIRALMVLATERRRRQLLELRNADDKIVVRVELDEPAEAHPQRPATATVRELRGYGYDGGRAAAVLQRLGLQPVQDTPTTTSDQDGTAVIDRQQPARLLLATALRGFLDTMDANLPGLLDDVDTEFLHDFRVAVRRTRSTLKVGRPVLPAEMRDQWEPAFQWLGSLTSPLRDLDVYELGLPEMRGWLVAADPVDLDPFRAHLRRRRNAARRTLVRGLKSARFGRLREDWDAALTRLAEPRPADPVEELTAGALADRAIRKASRRVLHRGGAVSAASPATDLHDLRKRSKELRYALEVFGPVVDTSMRKKVVADLKGLQDVLGRFQDTQVQRLALRGFAEEMVTEGTSAQAVLALGELIGHLDAEQDRARAEFDAAFATFARPAGVQRLLHLGGAR
jgi:CHAD domain-containing protein